MNDLISKQALIEDVLNSFLQCGGTRDDFVKHILFAPTIEAEPVVHGRWEPVPGNGIGGTARCSVCGKAIYGYHTMNYCPDCGAKMRKEEKEI